MLMVIVVLVLLIAGANVGNLLLSRRFAKGRDLCGWRWGRADTASCDSCSVKASY